MPKTLQFKRGTTAQLSSESGSVGELFVNTEKDTVVVMDGSTAGGFELVNLNANQTLTNKTLGATTIAGNLIPDTNITYDLGSSSNRFRDLYLSGSSIELGDASITASGSSIVLPAGSTISGGSGDLVDLNTSQILSNKTLDDVTLTGTLNAGGGVGTSGQVLKSTGTGVEWGTASGGSADLSAITEDVLPGFDEVYDIGSSTKKWYDGFFTNSVNIDTISLTNSSGTLAINSDISVTGDATLGSLLVDTLLLSENTITADASTALQYLGDKGVVEINNSNLDVREGDWIGVPVVETTNSIPPLTTGTEGIIRYNKDEGRFEGYNAEGWNSLGGLDTNEEGNVVITGNLIVSGDITSTSDETLKENIKSIEGALDTVTKLSGKMFTMKSDETQKEKVGFIAQEIEQHLPQVVSTDPNGIKSVSYGNVAALLVEAIKELNQKIEDLKK